jgi:hypothetical protein
LNAVISISMVLGIWGAIASAEPTTQPATSQPAVVTITVRAFIDGRSQLRLKRNTATWQNFDYAAPGKQGGRDEPTMINGVQWRPMWDDSDLSPEVRVEKALSDTFEGVKPTLAAEPMNVTLTKIRCREDASVVQQPSAANDFTTIVEFNDDQIGGADWYEVKLTFTPSQK